MHTTPEFRAEIRIVNRNNLYWSFPSKLAAAYFARDNRLFGYVYHGELGDDFGPKALRADVTGYYVREAPNFVARTAQDELVPADELERLVYPERRPRAERRARRKVNYRHVFRQGPVEHIHKRGVRNAYQRHPQTYQDFKEQEKLADDLLDANLPPYSKVCRKRELFTYWYGVGRCRQRSWKKHRKVQWNRD